MCAAGKGENAPIRSGGGRQQQQQQGGDSSFQQDTGLAAPSTSIASNNNKNNNTQSPTTTVGFDLWDALYSCGGWSTLLLSCQETLCHLQPQQQHEPLDETSMSSSERAHHSSKHHQQHSCNNFLDPHNFTIAHNDSMSTNATGEIDPDKIFAEQLSPVEALENMRLEEERDKMMCDDSSISSDGKNMGGTRRMRCRPGSNNNNNNNYSNKLAQQEAPLSSCPPGEIIALTA